MPEPRGIIALDLDGTLLDSQKRLSAANRAAIERAASDGWEIVPTTGRFYAGMPLLIRELPFVNYCITINGAAATDLRRGKTLFKAELPVALSLEIMRYLDTLPVIYDCFMDDAAWMTESMMQHIDDFVEDVHARKMLHGLRSPVAELKSFVHARGQTVQKIQLFTRDTALRESLLVGLVGRFDGIAVSSSYAQNVEINAAAATKGGALAALAAQLGVPRERTIAFGDGLNDLSMIVSAGLGIAMANACEELKAAADFVTASCDEDGVALGIEKYCVL